MRTMFRNAFSLLLLLPFLAGTLGISAREHRCISSNKVSIKLFPEFTGQETGCCCTVVTPFGMPAGQADGENLDPPDCCKTIRLYLRADFQTTQARVEAIFSTSFLLAVPDLPPVMKIQEISSFVNPSFFADTGPLLTGRQRVIFFHQSRIPCPAIYLS